MPRARPGFTLAELTVAMTIAAVLLALIAGVVVRQQRIFGDLADATALESRLHDAVSVLPSDLRALAPQLGDLRAASDSAVEIRATIATAVVCDTSGSRVLLAPAVPPPVAGRRVSGVGRYASFSTPALAGDTAWFLTLSDSAEQWSAVAITGVAPAAAGRCAASAPALDAVATTTTRVALTLASAMSGVVGVPVRITRPLRYSLYRASDGDWYLGAHEWNNGSARFDVVQPVAGPFLDAPAGGVRFVFTDARGGIVPSPAADPSRIAAVRIDVRGQSRGSVRASPSAGTPSARRVDSLSVAVAFRGRP